MLTDEQYGHQLGVHMRQETEDVRAAPGLAPKLRRVQNRRTWMARTAIAAPVAAAAVAAIVVTAAGPGTQPRQPDVAQPTSADPVQLRTVGYVTTQTVEAVGRASNYVIFSKTTYATGYYDTWTDKATQRYRNDGYSSLVDSGGRTQANGTARAPGPTPSTGPMRRTQSHAVRGPLGNQTIVTVDWERRTWSTHRDTNTYPPSANEVPDVTDAKSLRKEIANGRVELLGEETVDGRDALHLRFFATVRGYQVDIWVDSTTYLPIKVTDTPIGSTGPAVVTTTYSWLPRTGENLGHLVLTPPRGFKRV